MIKESQKPLILISFLSVTFIYAINLWFSISGFYLFFTSIIILLVLTFSKRTIINIDIHYSSLLALVFFIFTMLSLTIGVVDINGALSLAMWLGRLAMFLCTIMASLYFFRKPTFFLLNFIFRNKYFILIVLAFVIQLTQIRIVKVPDVDIYNIVKYGPMQIMDFKNPYITPATNPNLSQEDYKYVFYSYGPASLFLFLPFDVILGDPRYLLITANFIISILLYKISRASLNSQQNSELLSLIFLFNPQYLYFLTFSWVDPVIVCLLALGIFFLIRQRIIWSAALIGIIASIKIYYGIPLIFFLKYKMLQNKRFIFTAIATFIALNLPFAILDFNSLYKSTVLFHLISDYTQYEKHAALSFATYLERQFQVYPPRWFFPAVNSLIFLIYFVLIRKVNNLPKMLIAISLVFTTLIFFGPQGLASYFFTSSSLLLFALATAGKKSQQMVRPKTTNSTFPHS